MRIKKIILKNHAFFGNIEFDFTNSRGQIVNNIVLAGENGCGKTQLLNIIFDFSRIPTDGIVSNEERKFIVVLSPSEIELINSSLDDKHKLIAFNGEMVISQNFNTQPNYWSRVVAHYQYADETGNFITKNIDSHSFFGNENVKSVFKSIFSTVEINYNPKETSSVTSKEVDENVHTSIRSNSDLATEIQQLFIDIQNNDANELQTWVDENPNIIPPESVKNRRIKRFKTAFSRVFTHLNFHKIKNQNGKKKVYFKKYDQDVDIASLSSGEKQIVFRGAFLLQNQQSSKGTLVLIDEPEISLHPIWQTKIFDYYRKLFTESDNTQTSQVFIATHSQYVLQAALEDCQDTLIVLLKKTNNDMKIQRITAPFALPSVTSAELNYLAFDICSNDYHIELYGYLQNKIALSSGRGSCSVKDCDSYILHQSEYNSSLHEKISSHGNTTYSTLPTYIRNAIDHPDPTRTFTQEELIESIQLLIKLVK